MQKTHQKDRKTIERAVQKGVDYLYAVQRSDGSWQDMLPSSAIATGMIMVAFHLCGPEQFSKLLLQGAEWLRSTQRPDGGWGDAVVDPGNLNGTTIAIAALQLTDQERSKAAIERGWVFIEANGGIAAVCDRGACSISDFCLLLLALAGFYEWRQLKRFPLTLVLLPGWLTEQVSFTMPCVLAWALTHAQRLPTTPFRRIVNRFAHPRALSWIHNSQGEDGGFQESPFVAGVVYIGLKLANIENTTTELCLSYMLTTRRSDGSWPINRDLEFCATTYVLMGLEAANALDRLSYQPLLEWIIKRQHQFPY
jgi:squalene-hopene/tetraprenyl-beta-curcumene cyclase